MAESGSFDRYHKWLGIPPREQPPNHYRLLGLGVFEDDRDVIDMVAGRQIEHIRSLALGAHADEAQKLLNELATARICLLSADKKADYDAHLRAQLNPAPAAPAAPVVPKAAVSQPAASPPVVERYSEASPSVAQPIAEARPATLPPAEMAVDEFPASPPAKKGARAKPGNPLVPIAALALALLGTLTGAWWIFFRPQPPATSADRQTVALAPGKQRVPQPQPKPPQVTPGQQPVSGASPLGANQMLTTLDPGGLTDEDNARSPAAPQQISTAVGGNSSTAPEMPEAATPVEVTPSTTPERTAILGARGGINFEELPLDEQPLVGIKFTTFSYAGHRAVKSIQAVYRTGESERLGRRFGSPHGSSTQVVARPGYAVGAILVRAGDRLDALKLRFMFQTGQALDPQDSYDSDWLGGTGGHAEETVGTDGRLVVGIYGRSGSDINAIGLILAPPKPSVPPGAAGPAAASNLAADTRLAIEEFAWASAKRVRMDKSAFTFFFFSQISGALTVPGEGALLALSNDGYSYLGGMAGQPSFRVRAMAVRMAERNRFKLPDREAFWDAGQPAVKLLRKEDGFCVLAAVSGQFKGRAELAHVFLDKDGTWCLGGSAGNPANRVGAGALAYSLRRPGLQFAVEQYRWKAGMQPVKMISRAEGFCLLSGIGGAFQGAGEMVEVRIGDDGFWYLGGKSGQPSLVAEAISVAFDPVQQPTGDEKEKKK